MHLKNVYRPLAGVGLLLMSGCYAPYGGYPPGAYAPQGGAPVQFQGVPQSSYVMPGDALGSPSSGSDGAPSTFAPGGNIQAPDPAARGAGGSSSSPVPLPRDPDPAAAKPEGAQTSQFGLPSDPPEVSLGPPAELEFQSPVILAGARDRPAGAVVTASAQSIGVKAGLSMLSLTGHGTSPMTTRQRPPINLVEIFHSAAMLNSIPGTTEPSFEFLASSTRLNSTDSASRFFV